MRHDRSSEPRKLYLKVYVQDGYYITYDKIKDFNHVVPDPATRHEVFYHRGDYEGVYLTEDELAEMNRQRGGDYVIVTNPLKDVLDNLKINTAPFVLEYANMPSGSFMEVVNLGKKIISPTP